MRIAVSRSSWILQVQHLGMQRVYYYGQELKRGEEGTEERGEGDRGRGYKF